MGQTINRSNNKNKMNQIDRSIQTLEDRIAKRKEKIKIAQANIKEDEKALKELKKEKTSKKK